MVTGRSSRTSRLDVHQPYLQRRIDETDGAITVIELREELADHGHPVPYSSLRDWARSRLQWPNAPAPAPAAPSVRAVVGWITRHPDTLTEDEAQQLKAVLDACPELEQTHELVRDFAQMLTQRTGADLPDWINTARAAQLPGITGFARGLTSDLEAAIAGLTLHWSSGGTEGAATRVKKDQEAALRPSGIRTTPQGDPASVNYFHPEVAGHETGVVWWWNALAWGGGDRVAVIV
ncbi:transposase [Streptomyces sp. NPDC087903]|uniref:transposase n=1 Tax=Streptomyces sp. NPDC087903 TaxID=3365819 RepID=UPI0038055120